MMSREMPQETDSVGTKRSYQGGAPQKWFLDDRGRRMMMELYDGSTERVTLLQKELRVPRRVVHGWARQLGISRTRPIWTPDDIAYLERHFHTKSLDELARRLNKTISAVKKKAYVLGLSCKGEYSMLDLQNGLMCRYERVQAWMQKGWLKGFRKEEGGTWQFTTKAIRDFIFAHPDEINPRRLTDDAWIWLVDLLSTKGIGRLDEAYDRKEEA